MYECKSLGEQLWGGNLGQEGRRVGTAEFGETEGTQGGVSVRRSAVGCVDGHSVHSSRRETSASPRRNNHAMVCFYNRERFLIHGL